VVQKELLASPWISPSMPEKAGESFRASFRAPSQQLRDHPKGRTWRIPRSVVPG
jgi:hypothetical protein